MSPPDPDRLERGGAPPRCRRLDACLVASVLALFVLVFAGFTAALWFAWSVKDLLKPHQESGGQTPAALIGEPEPPFKVRPRFLTQSVTDSQHSPSLKVLKVQYCTAFPRDLLLVLVLVSLRPCIPFLLHEICCPTKFGSSSSLNIMVQYPIVFPAVLPTLVPVPVLMVLYPFSPAADLSLVPVLVEYLPNKGCQDSLVTHDQKK